MTARGGVGRTSTAALAAAIVRMDDLDREVQAIGQYRFDPQRHFETWQHARADLIGADLPTRPAPQNPGPTLGADDRWRPPGDPLPRPRHPLPPTAAVTLLAGVAGHDREGVRRPGSPARPLPAAAMGPGD